MERNDAIIPPMTYLELTQEEADALLSLLMNAPPSANVPEELAERLLMRVADAQRMASRRLVAAEESVVEPATRGETYRTVVVEPEMPVVADPVVPVAAPRPLRAAIARFAGSLTPTSAPPHLQEARI